MISQTRSAVARLVLVGLDFANCAQTRSEGRRNRIAASCATSFAGHGATSMAHRPHDPNLKPLPRLTCASLGSASQTPHSKRKQPPQFSSRQAACTATGPDLPPAAAGVQGSWDLDPGSATAERSTEALSSGRWELISHFTGFPKQELARPLHDPAGATTIPIQDGQPVVLLPAAPLHEGAVTN